MHSTILLATLAVVVPTILAEELRFDDVPTACKIICQPIVDLTNTCDVDPQEMDMDKAKRGGLLLRRAEESDEAIEANCICTNKSFDVAGVMGLCASCIAQNGATTDDASKIMSQCSFTSTSYTPAATTAVAGIQVQATKPASTGATSTGGTSSSTGLAQSGAGKLAASVVSAAGVGLAAVLLL
ncbi:hypothetical protein KVR01_011751 [Diaporthe batatas]|uniref:uncharacterized protein n=1 Tax=Diaporthe batatas TaxID=748121 RepID=UPI001D03AC6A|nr:uncharacterized protein KVR01_011751 [Diaporthe batatas]KAG8158629.1 hypothetical protein KVR01_011751 [Diaporthe batatas]